MLCGERSLVNPNEDGGVAVTLRCRSWSCEDCAPGRRAQLCALAEAGLPTRFLTLTCNPRVGVSPADRAARLARAARLVFQRWRRLHKGQRHEYLAVFEATKRGEPHLHMLVRGPFMAQRWISQQMREILNSPIVDIRRCNSAKQAARYVAKYVGKAPHRFATCKRYWHTRTYVVAERSDNDETFDRGGPWRIDDRSLAGIARDCAAYQVPIIWDDKHKLRWFKPPWMKRIPPPLDLG